MHWEPIAGPLSLLKSFLGKRARDVRAAFILLLAAWRMKPDHFRHGSSSIYKNLGWGIPVIPAQAYAWAAQAFYAPVISHIVAEVPEMSPYYFVLGNTGLVMVGIYFLLLRLSASTS